jgi:hypothetical protein
MWMHKTAWQSCTAYQIIWCNHGSSIPALLRTTAADQPQVSCSCTAHSVTMLQHIWATVLEVQISLQAPVQPLQILCTAHALQHHGVTPAPLLLTLFNFSRYTGASCANA